MSVYLVLLKLTLHNHSEAFQTIIPAFLNIANVSHHPCSGILSTSNPAFLTLSRFKCRSKVNQYPTLSSCAAFQISTPLTPASLSLSRCSSMNSLGFLSCALAVSEGGTPFNPNQAAICGQR